MGRMCVWIISLIAASLIGIASVQGMCKICGKYTKDENCTLDYFSPYPIDAMMCQSIAKNKNIETSVCAKHKNGYKILCRTRNSDPTAEVLSQQCVISCPLPKIINERLHLNGASRLPRPRGGVAVMAVMAIVSARWFLW